MPPPSDGSPHRAASQTGRQFAVFAAFGLANTGLYAVLFAGLRTAVSPLQANLVALSVTLLLSFAFNRTVTFGSRDSGRLLREALTFTVTYAATAALSSTALAIFVAVYPSRGVALESLVATGANAALFVLRFALLKLFVFRRPQHARQHHCPGSDTSMCPPRSR